MNGKERIEAIIAGKETDRMPFAVLDAGAWAEVTTGLSFRDFLSLDDAGASVIVKQFEKINSDIVSSCGGLAGGHLDALDCKLNIDLINATVNSEKSIEDFEEDIPKLDKSTIKDRYANNWIWQRILHQTRELKKLAGDEKLIAACIAGPFTTAGMLVGVQDFMLMLADDELEDELNHLLDYAEEASVVAYEQLREAGVDIAWFGEPVASGAMISQSMFEEFALEPIKRGYERLRESYKYIFMHMCGNSGARVSSIKDIGFDAFSVDAMVDLKQAGIDSEGKMVIIGNISPSDPLKSGTPQQVEAASREAVKNIKAGNGKLILCPGCDVPIGTPVENVLAMEKVARES